MSIFEISIFNIELDDEYSFESLLKEARHYCNQWSSLVQKLKTHDEKTNFYVGSYLSEDFKSYIIFLRNSALELIYAEIKLDANLITEEDFKKYNSNSQQLWNTVRSEFINQLEGIDSTIQNTEIIEQAHQKNPIQEYTSQIAELKNHTNQVKQFGESSNVALRRFDFIDNKIEEIISDRKEDLELLKSQLLELKGQDEISEQELSQKIKTYTGILSTYKNNRLAELDLQKIFKNFSSIAVIPDYDGGVMRTSTIDFPIILKQIFTVEFGGKISSSNSDISSVLIETIQHLRILSHREDDELHLDWIDDLVEKIDPLLEEDEKVKKQLLKRMTFHSLIYSETENKELASDYFDRQLLRGKATFLNLYQIASKQLTNFADSILNNEEQLSDNQLIINYIKSIHKSDTNEFYTKIFLNNSEFFNHYYVPSEDFVNRINANIENWRIGLGNAILMHGDRFCGKTSLLSWVKNNSEFDQFIEVVEGENIVIGGRKFMLGTDLDENLNSIEKSLEIGKSYLVIIDDLELIRNEQDPIKFLDNIRSLLNHIRQATKNVFFLVATNTVMANKLKTILHWEDHFADLINISQFKLNDFLTTLENRHQSTKMEVLHNEKPINISKIRAIGTDILKSQNYNIGLSLMAWCRNISETLDIKSVKFKALEFPWLIDDHRKFVELLYAFKELSYEQLGKLNNYTTSDYSKLIGRFRKVGVLDLNDNLLEISPFVGKELYGQLTFSDDKSKYNMYVINVHLEDEIERFKEMIENLLFTYSFLGDSKLFFIKEISGRHFELGLQTLVAPAKVIKFLNNHSSITAEFKNKII